PVGRAPRVLAPRGRGRPKSAPTMPARQQDLPARVTLTGVRMKPHILAALLAAAAPVALSACATTGSSATSSSSAYAAAQAQVQRLTAQANQNALLKPW